MLPVGVALRRSYIGRSTDCRVCHSEPETVCHVISHCRPMLHAITERHNTVLGRLTGALPAAARGSLSLGREMRSVAGQALKPDLVVDNGTDAVIVDVTCPFDGGPDALEVAAQAKVSKYLWHCPGASGLGVSVGRNPAPGRRCTRQLVAR